MNEITGADPKGAYKFTKFSEKPHYFFKKNILLGDETNHPSKALNLRLVKY